MKSARLAIAVLGWLSLTAAPGAQAADHAVAVLYHRFGDAAHPSTNVTLEEFEAHLDAIAEGGHRVLALGEIVRRLQAGEPLPEKALAITIDDAHRSIYEAAWPRLRARGLPFTVFLETGALDEQRPRSLGWREVREMAAAGVEFAPHSVSHAHLTDVTPERLHRELVESRARVAEMLGEPPSSIFAYPFGEYDAQVIAATRAAGYAAAFGQHSGVMHPGAETYALPRFAVTGSFAKIERYRTALSALPLPAVTLDPRDALIRSARPFTLRFRTQPPVSPARELACYASGERTPVVRRRNDEVEVHVGEGFAPGRARINCTQQAENGRWRWRGWQFTVRDASGATPPE